ncbi:MAG: family 20 glycosylhydrolase [bacterium]
MNYYKIIYFLLCVFMFTSSEAKEMNISVLPTPKIFVIEDGSFIIPNNANVSLIGNDKTKLEYSFELLNECLYDQKIDLTTVKDGNSVINFEIVSEDQIKDVPAEFVKESYTLFISESGISIKSPSYRGIYYGVVSLIQIIERTNNNLPYCKIVDYPDMKIRGVSDDISRGQVSTLDNFKKIIKFMARYKMNTYMPYMEDVVELKCYPSMGLERGALTYDEIKELHKFAEKHFVDIIPIFQTLGHYENILAQKEFIKYAEFPGAASLDVSNPDTYVFLENMLKEIFELFPSEYFHMGADESYDVGLGNSKGLVEKSNLAKVHLEHYKKVYAICKKYNKKVLMYGDILLNHPEILDELPKDITIVDWHYRPDANYPSTEKFNTAGFNYIVSPSVWNFLTPFPTNFNAIPNIEYIIKAGIENNSIGMINSNWGDYGAETIKELVLYGYAYSAFCSWNINASDIDNFSKNYFADFFNAPNTQIDEVYQIFSGQLNQMLWHDVFRHPALPLRNTVWWESSANRVTKNRWMLSSLPIIEEKINNAVKIVKRNNDHLDILNFMAAFNDWFVLKIQTQQLINDIIDEKSSETDLCLKLIDRNINAIKKVEAEYKNIWLKYYKRDNLNMIEDKFNRLLSYFNETKADLQNKTLKSPLIESKWIYYSVDKEQPVSDVKFKKTFDLTETPTSGFLQMLGDTYAKLNINGAYVDEISARRSLSLLVDYKRILFIDIAKYLTKGTNTIEVIVQNFNKNGSAGMNLIAQIKTKLADYKILSDESWWVNNLFANSNLWKSALVKDYPYAVTAPNFETKRTSWIER